MKRRFYVSRERFIAESEIEAARLNHPNTKHYSDEIVEFVVKDRNDDNAVFAYCKSRAEARKLAKQNNGGQR